MCGYAVELALKARICQTLRWPEFPSTPGEFSSLQSLKTHNLEVLLRLSGIEARIKPAYVTDWSVVSNWNPESRYDPIGTVTMTDAQEMLASAKVLLKVLL